MQFHLPKEMLRGSVWKRRAKKAARFASLIRMDYGGRALETGRAAQERAYEEAMIRPRVVWGS